MDNDFDRATKQIRRSMLNGLSLPEARIDPAPILTLGQCRQLSDQTGFTIEQLRAEFIGFKHDWEEFGQAMQEFKTEVCKPFMRIVDWLSRKLA